MQVHFAFYCISLTFLWNPECESLGSGAVYLIQNQGTKQCLAAGPVLTNGTNLTKSLFKEGAVLAKPCTNISNFESTDHGQEWLVRIQRQEPQNLTFQVELIMGNIKHNSKDLNATLHGEVISYFPKLINLKGKGLPGNELTQSHIFFIIDPATQQCLTDEIGRKPEIGYRKCVNVKGKGGLENQTQKWNFTLVNEIELIRHELNQSKHENASSHQSTSTKLHAL